MKVVAYSFDVFDTVLVRIWAKPTDLFWELGLWLQQEAHISTSIESWCHLRVKAERQARNTSPKDEVTLIQIYSQIASVLNWDYETLEKVTQKEIQLELLSLRPVPEINKKIEELHQLGERVIFISDMYLPRQIIQLALKENQILQNTDKLYISSEIGVTKLSGELFKLCLSQESLETFQLNHIGDNFYSDVKVPQNLGIKTQHFTSTQLNRYENLIYNLKDLPLKFRSLLAGTSRLTRLQFSGDDENQQVIWQTATSVIAPVLFGFVYWCLEEARCQGIKRLYFVSRDGQILLKIAKIICDNWDYNDIDCRYLYGSRQAWHFPAIQKIGDTELDWLFDNTDFLSVTSVCERVNLKPEDFKNIFLTHNFAEDSWNLNLNNQERLYLKEIFQKPEISDFIISKAAEFREKAVGYFCQEGLNDSSIPFGIVDIGWNGRLQRSLSKLLNAANIYPKQGVCGFYFGLHKRLQAYPTDSLLTYFPDANNPRNRYYIHATLLELFVAADHGSAVRFEKSHEQYIPILREKRNAMAIKWGLEIQQKAIIEWTNNFVSVLQKKEVTTNSFRKTSEVLLKEFVCNPSLQEAKVIGSSLHADDQNEHVFCELASKYSWRDAFALILLGRKKHRCNWLCASMVVSSGLPKIIIFLWLQMYYLKLDTKTFISTVFQTPPQKIYSANKNSNV
jgi:predicted HAD superfamily hydrolase